MRPWSEIVPRFRWRPQFKLRTLLIATALLCIVMATLGREIHVARQEQRAIDAIQSKNLAAWAYRDDVSDEDPTNLAGTDDPPGPDWLVEWLNRWFDCELFTRIHAVYFYDPQLNRMAGGEALSDSDVQDVVRHLQQLRALEKVGIQSPDLTDAGIQEFAELRQLKRLELTALQLTDTAVEPLAKLQQVTSIQLRYTQLTPRGIARLKKLMPGCRIEATSMFSADEDLQALREALIAEEIGVAESD